LSGGGAKLVGLRSLLEQSMAVPVRMTEPFLSFAVHKNIDREYLAEAAPYFAVASGLSIRRPGDK
jgi:Tfp pilus assembly PilM family ATPase